MLIFDHNLSPAAIATLRADANANAAFNLAESLSHWQSAEKIGDAEKFLRTKIQMMKRSKDMRKEMAWV